MQAIGAHTCAGGQCADAIEADVDADGPACIVRTGTGSGCLGRPKVGDTAGYVMPVWAGRMASSS